MKKVSLITAIIFLITTSAFAQTGIIRGTILSYDEVPLEAVSITLVQTNRSTVTNQAGDFTITNLSAGNYTLMASSVGYSVLKQNIKVEDNRTTHLHLRLSRDQKALEDVVVTAYRNGYQAPVAGFSRTAARLIDIPQSAQVVPAQVIRDRQAVTLNEISQVMTGVKANNGMGAFSLRGFTGYNHFDGGFITVDGIRGNMFAWSQQPLLYNIEKVEVLRGPASVLFSEGIPGGVINMVTKRPQAENRYELDLSYGTWNYARISADATGALSRNKKLMYRMIAGYDRSNSFRDQQETQNIFIAPSIRYQFNASTRIDLDFNYHNADAVHQYDRGSFVAKRADGRYDFDYYPNNSTVQSPTDFGKTNNISGNLHFSHQLNKNLAVHLVSRYVQSDLYFADHGVSGAIYNDSIGRTYQIWDYQQYSWQNTAYASYKLNTGKLSHTILAGVDYNNYGWRKNDYRNSPSTAISILNPNYSNDVPLPDPAVDYYDDNKQSNKVVGGYLQDQVNFGERWKLLLSLRFDNYDMKQTPLSARDDLQGDASEANAWTPRVGLVFNPAIDLALYAGYNSSFNPQLSNGGASGGPFPPRTAEQYEAGFKGEFFNKAISAAVAVYQINYKNILAADPTPQNPNNRTVVDGTESKGFELTLQGTHRNFSVIAGYAYNDHRMTSDNTLGKKGYRYINAPRNLANIWLKYTIPTTVFKGLGLGIGARYMDDQVGNVSTQDFLIPSSLVVDASVQYRINRCNFQVNIYNLTDERYYLGGLSRVTIASLGNPFNLRFSVNYLLNK